MFSVLIPPPPLVISRRWMVGLSRQVCLVSPFASRFRVANGFPRRFRPWAFGSVSSVALVSRCEFAASLLLWIHFLRLVYRLAALNLLHVHCIVSMSL